MVTEAGFNFVVWLIYTISGYENYLLVFAVFGAVTAFLFLKALYEQSDCFWQSFAMFMLLGVYFRTFTTVRYYLALAAALYGIRFVLRRQYGCFVIWIGIAALFHKSVLMVLPLYLLAVLPWKKWIAPALTVIGGIGFVFQRPLLNLALTWYPTYRDTVYLSQDIGLKANASGILRCVLVFMLAAVVGRCGMEKEQNCFCLKLNFWTAVLYLRIVFATGIENVLLYDYAAAAAHSGTAWLRGKPEAEKYFNSTCGDRMPGVFFVVFKNGIRKRDARASL